jgi:flavin-binding protein dodecin
MSGATYKSIDLVGTSAESYADATRAAVRRASETMRGLKWFEVVEQRGHIDGSEVTEFQVRVRVWFSLEA